MVVSFWGQSPQNSKQFVAQDGAAVLKGLVTTRYACVTQFVAVSTINRELSLHRGGAIVFQHSFYFDNGKECCTRIALGCVGSRSIFTPIYT